MTSELEHRQSGHVAHHRTVGLPTPDVTGRLWKAAEQVAGTEMVPSDMRGKPHTVFATMLAGGEIGLSPMESLRAFYIVDGKPSESEALTMTLAHRAGHDIRVVKSTHLECEIHARNRDWSPDHPDFVQKWEVADAAAAELMGWTCVDAMDANPDRPRHANANGSRNCQADDRGIKCKQNWRTYTRAMLRARCVTEVVRTVCPEVMVGATYTAEELGAPVSGPEGTPPGRDPDEWSDPTSDAHPDVEQVGEVVTDDPEPDPEPAPDGDVVDAELVDDDDAQDDDADPDEPEDDGHDAMPRLVRACIDAGIESVGAVLDAYEPKYGDDAASAALRHLADPEKRPSVIARFAKVPA